MSTINSTGTEFREIVDKCSAPGVKFEEHFEDFSGSNRNICSWFPEENKPKAIVFISHGLAEHALCYFNVAFELVKNGYGVYGMDHVSHGKSEGPRGIIENHETLYSDYIQFANTKSKLHSELPAFIVAHSLGTLVAIMSVDSIENISAMVLSGCAIYPGPDSASPFGIRWLYPLCQNETISTLITAVTSTVDPGGEAAPLKLEGITTDSNWLDVITHDPRRNKAMVTNKTAYEAFQLAKKVKSEVPNLTIPFLCLHGADDLICLTSGSEFVYKNAGTDITKREYTLLAGCKHEVFHEKGEKGVEAIQLAVNFLNEQYEAAIQSGDTKAYSKGTNRSNASNQEKDCFGITLDQANESS